MQIGSGLSWRNEKRLVFFVRSEAAPGGAGIKLSNYSPIGRGGRAVYIILYKMQHNKHVKENKFVFFSSLHQLFWAGTTTHATDWKGQLNESLIRVGGGREAPPREDIAITCARALRAARLLFGPVDTRPNKTVYVCIRYLWRESRTQQLIAGKQQAIDEWRWKRENAGGIGT